MHGVLALLFFMFCSGTHSLFEELGRHEARNGSQEGTICGAPEKCVE